MNAEDLGRRQVPQLVWWLVVLWIAVTAAAIIWGIPHEEENLTERANAAVTGLNVNVRFEGRDAFVSGEVAAASDVDLAAATVREVRGVRRVDTSGVSVAAGQTESSSDPEPAAPNVTITVVDGTITLAGTVPDQETVDAMVRAATTRFGADHVTDQLKVGTNTAGAAWLAGVVKLVDGAAALGDGSVSVGAEGAVIVGTVASDQVKASVGDSVVAALGSDIRVANELEVVALAEPSFEAALQQDGRIRLRGVMPDQAAIDDMLAAANAVYGSSNVVDEMTVADNIASPAYLDTLPAAFGVIDGLNPWQINVENGAAVITGKGVSADAVSASVERLRAALGAAGLGVTSEVEVDAQSVATVLTELLQGTATFQVGSANLSVEATGLLDEAIEILLANPTTVLTVEGHTDDVGSEDSNLALSEARAQAVVDYLVAGGVAAERLAAVGFGESRPIADNGTADGRAQNRRIEFVVEEGDL